MPYSVPAVAGLLWQSSSRMSVPQKSQGCQKGQWHFSGVLLIQDHETVTVHRGSGVDSKDRGIRDGRGGLF